MRNPLAPACGFVGWCVVLALAVCTFAAPATAQRKSIKQYVHYIWNIENGFPQNSANDILQTRDGYLWFATQDGVARFDGLRFTVFDRANTKVMPDSWVVALLEDSTGALWMRPQGYAPGLVRYANGVFVRIDTSAGLPSNRTLTWVVDPPAAVWVGSNRGLTRFRDGESTTFTTKDGLPGDTVLATGRDSRGGIWISTTRGLARMRDGKIETVTGTRGFPDTVAAAFNRWVSAFEDSRGTVWLRTRGGVASFDGSSFTRFTTRDGLPGTTVNWIHEDAKGVVWFGTNAGLARFSGGRFTAVRVSADPDENTILQIVGDREGSLWMRTAKGIARYANGSIERYQKTDGLSDDSAQRMFIDREGSIWVSTFGGGVDQFRDEKFVTYSSRVGLSYDNVQGLREDRTGALWVGTSFGGVNVIKNGTVTVYDSDDGFAGEGVFTIGEDHTGTVWVASNKGLFAFKDGKFRLRSRGSGDGQFPVGNGMISLRSGKFLVGSNNMLLEHRGDSFDSLLTVGDNPNQANLIRETFEDSRGALWISTESALYQYRDGTLRKLTARDGFPGGWVQSFYEDPAGTLWLGVSNVGLMRYRENTFTTISPEQGLFDYNVYTILEDDNGYLWMSSNKGAFRARKQQLNDVADGKAAAVSCDVYGVADGMGSRECNGGYSPSGFRLRDGRLAFSTTGGVTIVNPADIRINPIPPPVVIEKFVVEGVAQDTRSGIRIEPGKRRLEFHYAGISFIGAPQVRYRYQLVGLDKDWIDAGPRRDAYYTQLDPGTYTFRVIAANSDGVWNETGASLTFDMEPFFYQSSWFIGIVALFFLTSGPSFYLYRMRAMKKRRAELERQVQERTAELRKTLDNLKEAQNQLILSEKMASLGQLTAGIAHEIKNPLNFINNFAVLSHDLTADLRKELLAERDRVDRQRAIEIEEILRDLEQNVSKINEHGKRADSIVRGMLLHSRGKAGERQNTDLNALLAEYTNLAYHGMRAQDHSFNVKIETDLDPAVGAVSVVPQDLSRAFLNIINNACYAANEKRRTATNGFSPVVRVSARNLQDQVEIRIRDNGNGIPGPIREKIFNPFFTTKPAGVGTGLGLSLSYDIITQVHKGSIRVDTREGEFTEFVITIPRYPAEERGASS